MTTLTYDKLTEAMNKISCASPAAGIKIVYSQYACNPEYELVKRTWKERLFTRPWIPRRKHKLHLKNLNPQMFRLTQSGEQIIIAHPVFKEQLISEEIARENLEPISWLP